MVASSHGGPGVDDPVAACGVGRRSCRVSRVGPARRHRWGRERQSVTSYAARGEHVLGRGEFTTLARREQEPLDRKCPVGRIEEDRCRLTALRGCRHPRFRRP